MDRVTNSIDATLVVPFGCWSAVLLDHRVRERSKNASHMIKYCTIIYIHASILTIYLHYLELRNFITILILRNMLMKVIFRYQLHSDTLGYCGFSSDFLSFGEAQG